MAEKESTGFDLLFDLAITFIERQKSMLEYSSWMDYLLDMQKKGFEISDDMKTYLDSVIKTTTYLYETAMTTEGIEDVLLEIFEDTMKFLKKTKGVWDPIEWDAFLKDILKRNTDLNEETKTYFVNVLKAMRDIYSALPPAVSDLEREVTGKK